MLKVLIVLSILGVVLGLPTNSSKTNAAPRISGGEETDIERNPWQLVLLYSSRHYCGAVEIHPQWALTTAQCLEGVIVDHLTVRAGSTTKNFGGQLIDVAHIYFHPEFNLRTLDYDFALLQLDEPISIQTASPIALPEPNSELVEGDRVIITGWGLDSPNGVSPEILRRVEASVADAVICGIYFPFNKITDRMFCVRSQEQKENGACRGDGGGPVIINGRLAGLVSWTTDCGDTFFPGVHARVSSVLNWIYETSGI